MSDRESAIRVLHVDDEPDFGELTATFLEREDDEIAVETATSPADGLELLSEGVLDCIVSDYDMPHMNGIEFLEAVRAEYPDLPFILYTGKGSEEVASDAISAGVTDYLQKTSGTEQYTILANRIRNAVDGHRAQQAVEDSEQRLRRSYERITDGFFAVNSDWEYTYANEEGPQMLRKTREELLGETVWEAFPELVETSFGDALRTAMNTQETRKVEEYYQPHDTWYDVNIYPAENGISIYFSDVTERRERERKLMQLRERIQGLMYAENSTDLTSLAVSAADDIIGAPLTGIHLVNDQKTVLEPHAEVDSVSEVFTETPRFERDASPGSRAALVWDVFESGDPIYISSITDDDRVSEDTPAESVVLHPLGDHGIFIISSTEPDAFSETDRMLAEILANNLEALLDRVTREAVLQRRETRLKRLHEATRDLIQADSQAEITTLIAEAAEEILDFSITVVRLYEPESGGLVPVAATDQVSTVLPERAVFTPEGGSLNWTAYETGTVKVYNDIESVEYALDQGTGLRSLMILPMGEYGTLSIGETVPGAFDDTDEFLSRILATAAETALRSQEQKTQLQQRQDELEAQNDRLDEFASVIGHDLRNPLTVASLQLELVDQECDSEHLDAVIRANERMNSLVDDLLTLARDGEDIGETEPLAVASLVESCWETVYTAESSLVVNIDQQIQADRSRLQQLFENLFRNAVEHGSTSPDSQTRQDAVEHGGEGVTVTVGPLEDGFYLADDGPGITEEDHDVVFDAGYSASGDGTGFGLRIVKQIVDAHGWEIAVTDSELGGVRFEITGVAFAAD